MFVDLASDDVHLLPGSPAIDAGDPTARFDREPQPNGGRVDQGRYGDTAGATARDGEGAGRELPSRRVSPVRRSVAGWPPSHDAAC